jgi:hypothetical protein
VKIREVDGDLVVAGTREIMHNPRYESLYAPSQGPSQPFAASAAQRVPAFSFPFLFPFSFFFSFFLKTIFSGVVAALGGCGSA